MRVVLDTNILVSACWKPTGLEAQVVTLAIEGTIIPCVSAEIAAEYRDVLARPKLSSVNDRASEILDALRRCAVTIEPTAVIKASVDDDDNRFLECAEAAQAEYLITGNLRHYPPTWGKTKVTNARGFLSQPGFHPVPLQ